MFRLNSRNRKKTPKEKKVETKPKYVESFNEIILNDLVPEEKKEEFGLNSVQNEKSKKSSGVKLNLGLGGKKSNSKDNKSVVSKEATGKSEKHTKKNKKEEKSVEESSKGKKNKNSTPKTKKGKKSQNIESNKKSTKGSKTKKSKLSNPKKNDIEDIQEKMNENTPVLGVNTNKKSIGPKKKRFKHSSKQIEEDIKRNVEEIENKIEEDKGPYESEDNFDAVNFRSLEDVEYIDNIEKLQSYKDEDLDKKTKHKFENLVWSEDKFPKK